MQRRKKKLAKLPVQSLGTVKSSRAHICDDGDDDDDDDDGDGDGDDDDPTHVLIHDQTPILRHAT